MSDVSPPSDPCGYHCFGEFRFLEMVQGKSAGGGALASPFVTLVFFFGALHLFVNNSETAAVGMAGMEPRAKPGTSKLVPFIALYLAWCHREEILKAPKLGDWKVDFPAGVRPCDWSARRRRATPPPARGGPGGARSDARGPWPRSVRATWTSSARSSVSAAPWRARTSASPGTRPQPAASTTPARRASPSSVVQRAQVVVGVGQDGRVHPGAHGVARPLERRTGRHRVDRDRVGAVRDAAVAHRGPRTASTERPSASAISPARFPSRPVTHSRSRPGVSTSWRAARTATSPVPTRSTAVHGGLAPLSLPPTAGRGRHAALGPQPHDHTGGDRHRSDRAGRAGTPSPACLHGASICGRLMVGGARWNRTTDLTLIRGAL